MDRPESLTVERARSVLPAYDVDPEWQARYDRGELPEGLRGFMGMLQVKWPEEKLTEEEARYILWLREQGSFRWLADRVLGDSNQIHGSDLVDAAQEVIDAGAGSPG